MVHTLYILVCGKIVHNEKDVDRICTKYKYSRTCYEQPPLRHRKSGLLRQVAAHKRVIHLQNAILGDGQVASHRRLLLKRVAVNSRFYCTEITAYSGNYLLFSANSYSCLPLH